MADPRPPSETRSTLQTIGIGGFFGGLIAALILWSLWWVLFAVVIFVGTATLESVLQVAREELDKLRR